MFEKKCGARVCIDNAGEFDKTPRYTVKDVAEKMNISPHAVRYYDNSGLIPFLSRTQSNVRMFSDFDLYWVKIVHCLRSTDMSINKIKEYINLYLKGDATIAERAEIIFEQEKVLKNNIKDLKRQMGILKKKKMYYVKLLNAAK